MGTLAEIAHNISQQNTAVKGQAATPTTEAPKPDAQATEEAKRAEQVSQQPTVEERKDVRRAKLDALNELSKVTQERFVETQRARAEREKSSAETTALRAEMQAIRDAMAKKDAELESAKKNPLAWIQTQGVKLRQLAEEVAKGDAPDAKIDQLTKALQELDAKHEKQMADLKTEYETKMKEAADKEAKAAQQAEYAKHRVDFFSSVEKLKDQLPRLMKATRSNPERIIREFMITVQDVRQDPEVDAVFHKYTNEEILEATERRLEDMGVTVDVSKPAPDAPPPKLSDPKPTLTTSGASEPGPGITPDFKHLNEKQKIKAMADLYRQKRKTA